MAPSMQLVATALALTGAPCAGVRVEERAAANPIRKVVNMLQAMEKKVQQEGEAEKELYAKYMCYCKAGKGDLSKSIADAGAKISSLPSDIEASEEALVQAKDALKEAQTDRSAAKAAMAEATSIRDREAATYAATKAEYDANMNAVQKAVAAIEKGMAGAFLQTDAANLLEKVVNEKKIMDEDHRDAVLSFLSGGQAAQYAPSSGEITGILKELDDDMGRGLGDATATEQAAIKNYNDLMAAKTREVEACTQAVEDKTKKIGELGIDIASMKHDLSDTEKAYAEDNKFFADMDKDCAAKTAEWEVIVKTRADELAALADTIKVLNDDDALELFKKTLPSASANLLQVGVSTAETKKHALAVLRGAARNAQHRASFDLITVALTGKKVNFDKVVSMIDDMVRVLKEEQLDDDHKKEYCAMQFDHVDDKKKALARTLSMEATSIDRAKEAIATLADEMAALEAGIKALDRSVADASEQRKEENQEYNELMASDTAAKQLLNFAKNRLNKFYNPSLYKAPPKRELSAEDRIASSISGTEPPTEAPGGIAGTGISFAQISAGVAPPPPPQAAAAYKKKGGEGNGVIAMIDLLIADLDKELTEGETAEKEAQKDYEQLTRDSAEKRTADSKSLDDKASVKADTEGALQAHTDAHNAADKENMATLEYETNLHTECDWLIQNFAMRREARDGEIDSLKRAKDVLSGADFSLLERSTRRLRRSA